MQGSHVIDNARTRRTAWLVAAVIAAVIVCDQMLKIWVKTSFYMGEDLSLIHISEPTRPY